MYDYSRNKFLYYILYSNNRLITTAVAKAPTAKPDPIA
jgi:hypothetical protein